MTYRARCEGRKWRRWKKRIAFLQVDNFNELLKSYYPEHGLLERMRRKFGREPTLTEIATENGYRYWDGVRRGRIRRGLATDYDVGLRDLVYTRSPFFQFKVVL